MKVATTQMGILLNEVIHFAPTLATIRFFSILEKRSYLLTDCILYKKSVCWNTKNNIPCSCISVEESNILFQNSF